MTPIREGREQSAGLPSGLIDRENLDRKLCFMLPSEHDVQGREATNVEWLKLEHEGQHVEGKLYRPADKNTDKLIIFEPGLPGDGVTWFEEKHVPALVAQGYTVMALRHRGTRTSTDRAEAYVHCKERQQKGQETGSITLAEDREVNMDDLALEPAIALNVLGPKFSEIKLIGHSAGAPFSLHSLKEVAPEVVAKITNFVSLAGAVGGEGKKHFAKGFPPFEEYMKYCQTRLNLGDPNKNKEEFYRIVEEVYQGQIPKHIMMTLVHAAEDEYLSPGGAKRLYEHLGRGLDINDATQFKDESHQGEFHDLNNLRPETLIRLLDMYYPKSKHNATVKSREPKSKK